VSPYKLTYFPWPLTEKRLKFVGSLWVVTHPMKILHFATVPGFTHKGHCTLSTVKISGKFVPKQFRPLFKLTFLANTSFVTFALNSAYLRNETSHWQTKMLVSNCQSTMCPLKVDIHFVTFDQETAEIRWLIVTHPPYENSAFSVIARLSTQRPLNPSQPNFATC